MEKTKLELFIEQNLPKVLKQESLKALGDRKEYIGSSDVGGCLRKAYLDKVNGDNKEYDMATLIRFERGHISETLVRKMLTGLPVQEQVEIKASANGFLLKSHIDFLVENNDEAVIIEAKSVNSSIQEPYSSWVQQVQYQLHLLKINRNKPVRAYVIAIDLNSGWFKTFPTDYNEVLAKLAIQRAGTLIKSLREGKEPEAEMQGYCSTCSYKKDCPLMNNGAIEATGDIAQLAKELADLEKEKKEIEKQLKAKKAEIEELMRNSDIRKIKTGDSFISITNDSSFLSIDTKKLKTEDPKLYEELLEKYGKTVARKGYVKVQ